jgi:hypothetical protein
MEEGRDNRPCATRERETMIRRTKELEAMIEEFLGSPKPEALLFMPSCLTLAVNLAHSERFERTKEVLATSITDVVERLDGATEQPVGAPVHCEETGAAETLSADHCPVEILYQQVTSQGTSAHALQFRPRESNAERTYTVDELTGTIMTRERNHVLWVRFEAQPGVDVIVSDTYAPRPGLRIKVVCAGAPQFEAAAQTEQIGDTSPHHSFRRILDEAKHIGASEKGIREAKLYLAREAEKYTYIYAPQRVLIERLCKVSEDEFLTEVAGLHKRLLDASILSHFSTKITERLPVCKRETETHISSPSITDEAAATAAAEPITCVDRERLFDYAIESTRILDYTSLCKAAEYLGHPAPLPDENALRRYLKREITFLYKNRPNDLAKFDTMLDALERKELQERGWTPRTSERLP